MSSQDYTEMQRKFYNEIAPTDDEARRIIGNYDAHENYPYEDHLIRGLDGDISGMCALDFGCGSGRMIKRMAKKFLLVDGADISVPMLEVGRRWVADIRPLPKLFLINGRELNGIRSNEYDFIYCTISFQHIASFEVRQNLIKEFARVLRPGGRVSLQLMWGDSVPGWCVSWNESRDDAPQTNGMCDVVLCPGNIGEVQKTFEEARFTDFGYHIAPPPHGHHNMSWVYVTGMKRSGQKPV